METPLQDWFRENIAGDEMYWKKSIERQVFFIRDKICRAFVFKKMDEYRKFKTDMVVVSEHTSKSIKLPVYRLVWRGICCTMRYNFYDWKVTVESDKSILDIDKYALFDPKEKIHKVYCEGFLSEWVLGCYADNNQAFTVEMQSDFDVFCFFKILSNHYII